jgi:hypothetical protein
MLDALRERTVRCRPNRRSLVAPDPTNVRVQRARILFGIGAASRLSHLTLNRLKNTARLNDHDTNARIRLRRGSPMTVSNVWRGALSSTPQLRFRSRPIDEICQGPFKTEITRCFLNGVRRGRPAQSLTCVDQWAKPSRLKNAKDLSTSLGT